MTGIFISYRPEHTASIVGRLHDRLTDRFGPEQVVRDIESVGRDHDFGQRIDQVVASSSAFLAIISDKWLVDRNPAGKRPIGVPRDWVQREVEVALRQPHLLVIPVLIEGATVPHEQALPYSVRSLVMRNPMPLSDASWDDDVANLIAKLEQVVDRGQASAPPLALDAEAERAAAAGTANPDAPPTRRWFRKR